VNRYWGPPCSRSERGPDGPGTAANRDDSGWPLAILPGTAVVTACPGLAAYESRYEPGMLAGNRKFQGRSEARMSEPDQGAAAAAAAVARPAPASLFIVERRLPKASEHHVALLQAGGAERQGKSDPLDAVSAARRRSCRSERSTSTTRMPAAATWRASPAP
jgi:hypothetical protein